MKTLQHSSSDDLVGGLSFKTGKEMHPTFY